MADQKDLQNSLNTLKLMDLAADPSASHKISNDNTVLRSKNTKDAVTALLQTLLDKDALSQIRANSRQNNLTPAIPTYNVRTPIIELELNGVRIFPTAEDGDRSHFESFTVSFPISGVEGTVTGSIKLFAKDPSFIIAALDLSTNNVSNTDSTDGLPLLKMRWGWAFATPQDGNNGIRKVWTPWINFLIMNVEITNPEVFGTDFTFTLQDIGNSVLQFSAANLVFESDYPQQQIRRIVEGCLGFRLFTLDDLLNIDPVNTSKQFSPNDVNDPKNRTFFVNDKLGPLRTVGNNFLVVLTNLATQCKCKWYSTPNNDLAKAITTSGDTAKNLDKAQADLAYLKGTKADTAKIQTAQSQVDQYFADMSFSCKLYWIDNVPANWVTTSGTSYISQGESGTGAFFLLPDLSDTTAETLNYIELNYGPGASSFPYLHGSAQNVFNASIVASGNHSQTFGDVTGVNIQYSPFVTMLKSSVSENAVWYSDTDYIATSKTGNANNVEVTYPEPEDTSATINKNQQLTQAKINVTAANSHTLTQSAGKAVRQNFRFSSAVSKKNYAEIVDSRDVQNNPDQKTRPNVAPDGTYTAMKLRSRINHFLKWPFRASLTVLGDPTLIRLNQGGFELLSYFPSQDGKLQNLNTMLSGIYYAVQVTHTMTLSDYTTTISGLKTGSAKNVGSLVTKVIDATQKADTADRAVGTKVDNSTATVSNSLSQEAIQVDLSDNSFTKGFLSKSLQQLYTQQVKQSK